MWLWTVKRVKLKVDSIFLIFFNGAPSTGGGLLKKCFPVNSAKTPASESPIFNKLQA